MNILRLLCPKSTVAYLTADTTIQEGLDIMRIHHYTALPVIAEDGAYLGTVSEGDFLWKILGNYPASLDHVYGLTVAELIRPGFNPSIKIDVTMDDLLLQVMDQNFLPVIDDRGTFVGIVTRRDVIKYFHDLCPCEPLATL